MFFQFICLGYQKERIHEKREAMDFFDEQKHHQYLMKFSRFRKIAVIKVRQSGI